MEPPHNVEEGEHFEIIEEFPGYFISNHKRVYNAKTKHFLKLTDNYYFHVRPYGKVYIRPLWNKYFNQPDEMNLIAIINHGSHYFRDYYFDRENEKYFHFVDGTYQEIIPHKHTKNKNSMIVNIIDMNGKHVKLPLRKFKSSINANIGTSE